MRILFWTLLTLAALLDAVAQLCAAAVCVLFGIAWTASLPFRGCAWLLLFLSRRISSGRAR